MIYYFFTDPDPPQVISVISNSQSTIKLTWSAGQCNMGFPKEISVTVFKRNRELLKESILNITNYVENTGVGVTFIEKGDDFSEPYSEWVIKVSYNGRTEPIWSRSSPSYFATISGM